MSTGEDVCLPEAVGALPRFRGHDSESRHRGLRVRSASTHKNPEHTTKEEVGGRETNGETQD